MSSICFLAVEVEFVAHSFLQYFLPSKCESKIVSPPFCFPPTEILKCGSHPDVCTTGLHKLTTNTLSTCVISCNTHEQKQVSRRKLIFQIHKQTHPGNS